MSGEKNTGRAVIFDLDGTLLNTLGDLTASVNFALAKGGFPARSESEVNSFIGNGVGELIRRALPCDADKATFDRTLALFKEYYREHANVHTCIYDGLTDTIKALRADGYKIAVVTNKVDFAAKSLCREYFGELVDITIGDRDGVPRKPDPTSVFEAMRTIGCERAVYVGDSDVDIATAKNANIPCVSVTWGFRERTFLEACGGTVFADNAEALYRIIKGMEI